jgi:alpha-galactosidase
MFEFRLPKSLRLLAVLLTLQVFACESIAMRQAVEDKAHEAAPLKVFILSGQSNMQGHAHVRTLNSLALDSATAPMLAAIQYPDGKPKISNRVWISSLGSAAEEQAGRLTTGFGAAGGGPKFGPELAFGLTMEQRLGEPILIIKTAWGGKSLHTDFRPPSAGKYEFNEEQLSSFKKQGRNVEELQAEAADASGRYYELMINHVRTVLADIARVYPDYDSDRGYELAGFVWFQGWNDMVDRGAYPNRDRSGGYDEYSRLLSQFIRDVRHDLDSPSMPFVIGVMGVGGPLEHYSAEQQRYKGIHRNFREAMAAPAANPEFAGNVVAVQTAAYWDMEFVALQNRERAIKPEADAINSKIQNGSLSADEGSAALKALYARHFSQSEMALLKESTSNAEYHYLGSARIITRIGEAFAESLVELIDK